MIIRLDLPDPVWGRLASVADQRGVMVVDLIGDAVLSVLDAHKKPSRITPEVEQQIRTLRDLNRTYRDIAAIVGLDATTVLRAAKRLGLQPSNAARLARRTKAEPNPKGIK